MTNQPEIYQTGAMEKETKHEVTIPNLKKELQKCLKLRMQNKFEEAKKSFDEYFTLKDEQIRRQFIYSFKRISKSKQDVDPKMFKSVSELKGQQIRKFLSQIRHLDQQVTTKLYSKEKLSHQQIKKVMDPSLMHKQIQLLNSKISFYKSIGLQKQVLELSKSLILSNKSSLFPTLSESCNVWIKKAENAKKQGGVKKSIDILKQAVASSKDNWDKSTLYRKMAYYLQQIDKDGNQVISTYDKAISNSTYQKVQISLQRKICLYELSKIGSTENHKGLLKYMDQLIKNANKNKSIQLLVQKAVFLKNNGDSNQALKLYKEAIQKLSKQDNARKAQLLRQQAYILADIGKIPESISCMQKVQTLSQRIQKPQFYRNVLKKVSLDSSSKNLINSQISNTSLYYPFGCDTNQHLQRSIKLKKAGKTNQAIQLLKKGIQVTEQNESKSQMYRKLTVFLKQVDKDGHQIMTAYDKAISLSQFDKAKISTQRKSVLWKLASMGSIQTHKGLIKYFDQLPKYTKKSKIPNVLVDKANLYKKLGDTAQAIKSFSQAVQSIQKSQIFLKAQILRQQAYFLRDLGKSQQAISSFEQAQKIYACKSNDKIRFLWSTQKIKQIQSIIQNSKEPYEVKTIAGFYMKEGDKLKQKTTNVISIRQKYLQSVRIYDKAIKMTSDYLTIKAFLEQQALALKKAHGFTDMEQNIIEKHQRNLLSQMNILQDYKFMVETQQCKEQTLQRKQITNNRLLQKSYLDPFSLRQMFQIYGDKVSHYFIQLMTTDLVYKLWNVGRHLQSNKVFQKAVFIKKQHLLISQHQSHTVLRKSFQATQQFKAQNYKQCLNTLKSISLSSSIQQSLQIQLCKNKQLQIDLQKLQAISLWNQGNYDAAAKVFSDMIFSSKKEASQFIKPQDSYAKQCQMILKYNAILYNLKDKNFNKCIKKMKKFEKFMTQCQGIKDSTFYINWAVVYFQIAKKLKAQKSDNAVQNYYNFMQNFKKANQIKQISKNHEVFKYLKISMEQLKQTFFNNVRNMQEQVIVFRDLCFNDKTKTVVYNDVKDYINKMNQNIQNCYKIKQLGIISDTKKLDSLNTLKQCWDQTCYVLYKQVINKGTCQNLKDVKKLIDQLRAEMENIKKNHGVSIDKDSLDKLPNVVKQIKEDCIDQFQSVMKSRTNQALSQIDQAYAKIQKYLESGKCQNSTPDQIIKRLVSDNLQMKQKNKFFLQLIDDLQQQIDSKMAQNNTQNTQNPSQLKSTDLLQMIKSSKTDMLKDIQQRMNKKMQQIDTIYKTIQQNITKMNQQRNQQSSSGSVENGQVMKQLVSSHLKMRDQNKLFKQMIDQAFDETDNLTQKLSSLQKTIAGLQGLTKSTISVHEIQDMLRQLAQKHVFDRITQQSQDLVKKMIQKIQQDKKKQNPLQKNVYDYVDKNIKKLLDYISSILEPLNDGNVDKYFKRFKDDLLLRDNKIRDLQSLLKSLNGNQQNAKLSKDVEQQIKKLQQQVRNSKVKVQNISQELKKIFEKFTDKATQQDLQKLRQQLQSSYMQSDDIAKKLQLLSNDTLIGNYQNLLQHLDHLQDYIAVNDKKINILGNKLGTKIVTSFNGILRNDQVKFDKHGKLKFQPQKSQIRMNVNAQSTPKQNKQNKDPHSKTNPSMPKQNPSMQNSNLSVPKKLTKQSSTQSAIKLFRTRPVNEKYKVTQVSRVIDKGRKNVDMQGQVNRKLNIVIMQNPHTLDF